MKKKLKVISKVSYEIFATKTQRHKALRSAFVLLSAFVPLPAVLTLQKHCEARQAGSWQKKTITPILISVLSLAALAFSLPEKKKITIWLCGDSTMSIKETKTFPETGWGMPFVYFWDSTITVANKAKNGRSTSSFRKEGLWKQVTDHAGEGDYVFIQFGHNDEVPTKKTYTTETEFTANLKQYVNEARAKKASPVLLTPMARRKFDANGKIEGTHDVYSQLIRNVAAEEKVPLFDMDRITQALCQQWGVEPSKLLFLQLKPGEHPNYPEGKEDNTHFSELGARLLAQLVLREIRAQLPELAGHIYSPVKK